MAAKQLLSSTTRQFLKSTSAIQKSRTGAYTRFFSTTALKMVSVICYSEIDVHWKLTAVLQVQVGDSVPNVELWEDNPRNKINIKDELASGNNLVIGIPAAYSPACSDTHIPGYIADSKTKQFDKVFVIGVNDAFV